MTDKEGQSAKWTEELKMGLCVEMVVELETNNFTDSGFKGASWKKITKRFNENHGVSYNQKQLQSQNNVLKKR